MKTESKTGKLKMVTCAGCGAKVFISGDLPPFATVPCSKCDHPVMLPTRLRQFELRGLIAAGGMGTVFRAWDLMLEREVAVKLLKKDLAQDKPALDSFVREARICAALNHTNIVHIYTFDLHDDQYYIAMELADRGSMDQRIEQDGHLPELHVLDIGIKVASALDTALKHSLLHRDIKPSNILFNADGEPKLVDFGLAGQANTDTAGDTIWGTVRYLAPEKVRREAETFLSDMYSLGATLYHGLTGHVPFEAETEDAILWAHVNSPVVPPDQVLTEITHSTSEALVRALAKTPAERYQSYDEFIMALTAARSRLLVARYHAPHYDE